MLGGFRFGGSSSKQPLRNGGAVPDLRTALTDLGNQPSMRADGSATSSSDRRSTGSSAAWGSKTGPPSTSSSSRKYVTGDPSLEPVVMALPRPHDHAGSGRSVGRVFSGFRRGRSNARSSEASSMDDEATESGAGDYTDSGGLGTSSAMDSSGTSSAVDTTAVWEGDVLWKVPFNKAGVPQKRFFKVVRGPGSSGLRLQWSDNRSMRRKPRYIDLKSVEQIRRGHATPAFMEQLRKKGVRCVQDPNLCFSLVGKTRSVDMAATTVQQRDDWFEGLRLAISGEVPSLAVAKKTVDMTESRYSEKKLAALHARSESPNRPTKQSTHEQGYKSSAQQYTAAQGASPPAQRPPMPAGSGPVELPTPATIAARVQTPSPPGQAAPRRRGPTKEDLRHWGIVLFDHVRFNRVEDTLRIFDSGCPVDLQHAGSGDTALLLACRHGWVEIADMCLQRGAKNDPHPHFGRTALQTAIENRHHAVARLILRTAADSGADSIIVNHADDSRSAALHVAAGNGDDRCVQLLLDHGADQELVDANGQTPLHVACTRQAAHDDARVRCVQLLLDYGGDDVMNRGDRNGDTPLHIAATKGSEGVVRALLQTAANPLCLNKAQFTPIQLAERYGNHACISVLREYEVDSTLHAAKTRASICLEPGEAIPDGFKPGLRDSFDDDDARTSPVPDPMQTFGSPRGNAGAADAGFRPAARGVASTGVYSAWTESSAHTAASTQSNVWGASSAWNTGSEANAAVAAEARSWTQSEITHSGSGEWLIQHTDEGDAYYIHSVSGEARWELPAGAVATGTDFAETWAAAADAASGTAAGGYVDQGDKNILMESYDGDGGYWTTDERYYVYPDGTYYDSLDGAYHNKNEYSRSADYSDSYASDFAYGSYGGTQPSGVAVVEPELEVEDFVGAGTHDIESTQATESVIPQSGGAATQKRPAGVKPLDLSQIRSPKPASTKRAEQSSSKQRKRTAAEKLPTTPVRSPNKRTLPALQQLNEMSSTTPKPTVDISGTEGGTTAYSPRLKKYAKMARMGMPVHGPVKQRMVMDELDMATIEHYCAVLDAEGADTIWSALKTPAKSTRNDSPAHVAKRDDSEHTEFSPRLKKYAKMAKMGMPIRGPVKQRMIMDGLDGCDITMFCDILEREGADRIFSSLRTPSKTPASVPGSRRQAEPTSTEKAESFTPRLEKFAKMLNMGMPLHGPVRHKMVMDGIDSVEVEQFCETLDKHGARYVLQRIAGTSKNASPSQSSVPAQTPPQESRPTVAVEQFTPRLQKYARMCNMGMPLHGPVRQRMVMDGLERADIDKFCEVLDSRGAKAVLDAIAGSSTKSPGRRKSPAKLSPTRHSPIQEAAGAGAAPAQQGTAIHDKRFGKYVKMLKMGLPVRGPVWQRMLMDGIAKDDAEVFCSEAERFPKELGLGVSPISKPAPMQAPIANAAQVKQDPKFARYVKMKSVGVPLAAVKEKMTKDKVPAEDIDIFVSALGTPSTVRQLLRPKPGQAASKAKRQLLPATGSAGPAGAPKPPRRQGVQTLKLHWNTLPPEKLEKSVWATPRATSAPELEETDIKNLEQMFRSAPLAAKAKKASKPGQSNGAKPKPLLDFKRSNNLSIGLAQFRRFASHDDIFRAVYSLDHEDMPNERLEQLLDLVPSTSEVKLVQGYRGDKAMLGTAEQWVASAGTVPRLKAKVEAVLYRRKFDEICSHVEGHMRLLTTACQQVMGSERLATVLVSILAIGNIMNSGTQQGGAQGFRLDALLKLSATKSVDKKTTLIDYLVSTLESKGGPTLLSFSDDLRSVRAAKRLRVTDVSGEVNALKGGLLRLKREGDAEERNVSDTKEDAVIPTSNVVDEAVESPAKEEDDTSLGGGGTGGNPMFAELLAKSKKKKASKKKRITGSSPSRGPQAPHPCTLEQRRSFVAGLRSFAESADKRLQTLLDGMQELQQLEQDLAAFFGEDRSCTTNKVFDVLFQFLCDFDRSRQVFLRKRKAAARRASASGAGGSTSEPSSKAALPERKAGELHALAEKMRVVLSQWSMPTSDVERVVAGLVRPPLSRVRAMMQSPDTLREAADKFLEQTRSKK